ncbi:hypothetical protein [Fuerstiella marisgermanici]|uniref:hypothetical protein n=1 Tax=Fuerstiella marisgermanici TaxID=1891926 RepID=UPI0011AB778B|nr:hypothetical protein [Fuerstiella marisgermanici]
MLTPKYSETTTPKTSMIFGKLMAALLAISDIASFFQRQIRADKNRLNLPVNLCGDILQGTSSRALSPDNHIQLPETQFGVASRNFTVFPHIACVATR